MFAATEPGKIVPYWYILIIIEAVVNLTIVWEDVIIPSQDAETRFQVDDTQ